MFSKSRPQDAAPRQEAGRERQPEPEPASAARAYQAPDAAGSDKPKPAPSVLSADLVIKGNVRTSGDVTVEGQVEGDIRAQLLTIGESATVKGEVVAEEVVINGRIIGRVRGLKVRLTASARVEGDIVHKVIAIESGAHFEGSVQRQDDPIQAGGERRAPQGQPGERAAE